MGSRLQDKVALVTGGSGGIGAAICHRFAEEGAHVIVSDIDPDTAEGVRESIEASGHSATSVRLDVASETEWAAVIEAIVGERGRLDVLVNNAGIAIAKSVEDTSIEEWELTQQINSRGVFLGLREAIRAMKQNGGSIINISSIEGLIGEAMVAAYCASKGAVRLLTKSTALHCANEGYGIRVNSVHPGFIETPMVANGLASVPEELREAFVTETLGSIPLGRMGAPAEVANGCLFLASDESSYMTGSELVIDGGFTAR